MRSLFALALLGAAFAATAAAEQDCPSGERYLALAQEKAAGSELDAAADLAQRAVEVCPSYNAFESLGELRARSFQRSDHALAVEAFVSAESLAPTDSTRAQSLYQYARLLNLDGDPQNAYPLIRDATTLNPGDADITTLAAQIKQRIDNPTKEQITRGLWNSLYKPLRMGPALRPRTDAQAASAHTSPLRTGAAGGTALRADGASRRVASSDGPSVNIPINFEFATTTVDQQTRANIEVLASALGEPSHAQQHFTFVGHADSRGTDASNLILSRRRAEALSQAVVQLQPSLQGRIDVMGRGSSEPIDPAHNEEAYRANRRLQVLLK
jgi:outer membrane protein OmpA-like peptidoglycan-associated protein